MIVDILKEEQNEMKVHEHPFVLWPKRWQTYNQTHDWTMFKLTSRERRNIPNQPGIYSLVVQPDISNHPAAAYLVYVGKAESLRRRFGDYLNKERRETGRPKVFRWLNMYPDHIWFCFTLVAMGDLISIEENLLSAYIPPANDQFPAEIRRVVGAFR